MTEVVGAAAGAQRRYHLPLRGLVLLALLLAGVFAGVAWLQARSLALLNGTALYQGDNIAWSFYQLESESMRLREAVGSMLEHPDDAKVDALRERYEIFVSRISLVDPDRTSTMMQPLALQAPVLKRVMALVDQADDILGPQAPRALDPRRLNFLYGELWALAEPLRDLALQANQEIAEQIARRNDAVRWQNQVGIGLTAFLSVLTILFAFVVVRQLQALNARRQDLEALTASLSQAHQAAEQASQAKSVFLANLSHELRTPFNGLLGMLALLQRSSLTPQQADQLETARESGEHLLGILNDVLDISKLESGRLDLHPQPTDLRRVLADVQALMQAQADARSLHLGLQVSDSVPARVLMDAKRFKQIVFNLLSNAIKFTEQGEVLVRVDTFEHQPAGLTLRLRVSDTGIGMDLSGDSPLFERFSQGGFGISQRYGGTGLGLEISRSLARRMGGDVSADSALGQGSCFTVLLPLETLVDASVEVAPDSAGGAAVPNGRTGIGSLQVDSPSGGLPDAVSVATEQASLILVVDDHPVNRKFLQLVLESAGYRVRAVADGASAVEVVAQGGCALVLMDLHMPGMDGVAATRAIRALPGARGALPIVALTADAYSESRDRVLAAGMDEFLAKPVRPQEIEATVRRLLLPH
jgi:signal transduction histidine kinase/ActR/RegA family two-component response regulator